MDNSGNAFITGITLSANFPTQNAYQPSIGGSQTKDAFLIEVATGATKTCTVNNTSDDAATGVSYRNALSQSPKCDIINFNFGGSSTINIVNTPLPEVSADVIINGSCSNNQPLITINGTGITGTGLYLSGGDAITCLKVQHFSGVQILATDGSARNNLDHVIAIK